MTVPAIPLDPVFGRRVVICGSMSFYGEMLQMRSALLAREVRCVLPDAEDPLVATDAGTYAVYKRNLSFAHLRRIRNPETFALLVVNFDKRGVDDYIGPSTFAEIAVGVVHLKRIFLLNGVPEEYMDELNVWQAVPLYGSLDQLVHEYRESCARETRQLRLFPNL